MITSFILILSLASAMSAPNSQKNEALQALVNPTPEVLSKLNQLSTSLQTLPSLAASYPELTPEANLSNQAANLNILEGLNSLIMRLIMSFLERLLSGSFGQAAPTSPAGTDIFGAGAGTGNLPNGGTTRPSPLNPFNPFSFLLQGAGNSPFGSVMSPLMFGNALEGFMELF